MNWTLTRKQPPNRRVVLALLPCVAGGVYFFGWRSLAMVAVSCLLAYGFEWLFCRSRKEKVSEAAFVTGMIYALILPPTAPWHVVGVGAVFAIAVTKELFGGFGRNIFNPAMAGRAFVYICFPVAMTAYWAPNVYDLGETPWYGALNRWSTQDFSFDKPSTDLDAHGYTGATPGGYMKDAQLDLAGLEARLAVLEGRTDDEAVNQRAEVREGIEQLRKERIEPLEAQLRHARLLLGPVRGTMGVTSVVLILIGGGYLFWTKTANRTIILSTILSCAVLAEVLHRLGVRPVSDGLTSILAGGFLFGAFFMATDPISAPKTHLGRIVYGAILGGGRVVIASFSVFNGGFMFALLLGNMFAPTLDVLAKGYAEARKARAEAKAPSAAQAEGGAA